jgi:CelD/BcsL family acetyltransferase involved in cellulose biosynthesis
LLLDAKGTEVLEALAAGIRELGWPLLWLDEAVLDAPQWQRFEQACASQSMLIAERVRCQVGRVRIDHDWPAYRSRWSRKHRQHMAQAARRFAELGDVRLVIHTQLASADVATVMQQCFAIEDRSWKGAAGSSVLRTPGMAEFYVRQAEQAAWWGQLEVVMLYCGERAMAFSYGLSAKGIFHSIKVSYDPLCARYHPGQLLRYYMLERFFADPARRAVDFQGPMTDAHAAWLPERYTVGRLAIAPGGLAGRLAVRGYRNIWPLAAPWVGRGKGKRGRGKLKRSL